MTLAAQNTNTNDQEVILVTGGAGFIGSHTVVQLLSLGKRLVIIDNLCNSSEEALHRAKVLADNKGSLVFHKVDLLDAAAMEHIFQLYTFSACIHFAGLKAVGESAQIPLGYYQTNVTGSLNLIQLLQKYNCKNLIFSSSATVYGLPTSKDPINEDAPIGALNPYGRTKQYIEEILADIAVSEPNQWNIILLRYFNPVGAHESGKIGEDPNGIPNNLMPFVAQVAIGRRPVISVYGDDYDSPDGTGVRDYIHIVDLARGHVAALKKLETAQNTDRPLGCVAYNLGSGVGYSVMDMIHTMSKAVGRSLPYKVVGRRAGDVGTVIADPSRSFKELGWKAEKTMQDMCDDLWRWQTQNPDGYTTEEETSAPTTPTPAPHSAFVLPTTLLPIVTSVPKAPLKSISVDTSASVPSTSLASTRSPTGSPAPGINTNHLF
ncbi:MAG: UDP-glucose 4-epimerase [Linnemannia elongata]|nr:MAG: UDP-glucose 4-epimerase [Linnemannia elongata]